MPAVAEGLEQSSAGSGRLIAVLALLALTFLLLSLLGFFLVSGRDAQDGQYLLRAAQLQALSQQIAKYAPVAAAGDEEGFVRLRQARARAEQLLAELKGGVPREELPASPLAAKKYLDALEQRWQALRQAVDQILEARQAILATHEYARAILSAAAPLRQQSDRLVTALAAGRASAQQLALAGRQLMLAQRLQDSAQLVLTASPDVAKAIGRIAEDAVAFARSVDSLRQGDAALDVAPLQLQGLRSVLADINALFLPLQDHVAQLHANQAAAPALEAVARSMAISEDLSDQAAMLVEAYSQSPSRPLIGGFRVGPYSALFLGALAALALGLLGLVLVRDAKQAARLSAEHQACNRQAIAGNGAATVARVIECMAGLQGQIQHSSRRLKRLGESSQEIGAAVELIEDISDQTHMLAINAAIQASLAGEAGRGFVVVADEIQRLAERTTQATGRIEALVRAIQADTGEAIASTEAGAAGLLAGERLAWEAGEALRQIETASQHGTEGADLHPASEIPPV